MTEPVNVLWTSGWDSTYRVADLVLNHGKVAQPHYVMDRTRPSTPVEIKHQGLIREEIARISPEAAERILPTIGHEFDDVPADPSVTAQLVRLTQKKHLGSQYDFLSRMARANELNDLELCVHRDDYAVESLGDNVKHYSSAAGGHYALSPSPDDLDLELFRPFRFPLLDMTKVEMGERASASGFGSVMELTWFCHNPISGTPCGFCNPCKYTREEGLGRRVPEPTRARWVSYMVRRKGGGLRRKVERKLAWTT